MPLQKIASVTDIPSGKSHYVDVTEHHSILIANIEGQFYAVYGKCSHYNLPLKDAAVCDHRLRCPFHHACFDLRSGAQLEAPGLGGLQSFPLEVSGDDIYVDLPAEWQEVHPQTPPVSGSGKEHFLIVGGGIAAVNAVIGIRSAGSTARITLVSAESVAPYDRTALSKSYLQNGGEVAKVELQSDAWYREMGVQLRLSTEVKRLDPRQKVLVTAGGESIHFDKALIATGGKARALPLPGTELKNVFTVRHFNESKALREAALEADRVVVVGAGFIGLEMAMSLGKLDCEVTVVAPETVPFQRQWGHRVGRYVQSLHEAAGVKFELGHQLQSLNGEDGQISSVSLENGRKIDTDLVVIGVGMVPNTDFVKGIQLNDDQSLMADQFLMVSDGIYAAGDLTTYPDPRYGDLRIEHWKVAAQQGRVAGRNMGGDKSQAYNMIPYFWSNQQGKNFRYAGHATEWDQILFDGDPESGAFIARYGKSGKLVAVLGLGRDQEVAKIAERELR